ncbi:tetratricopeptide repeat protein [Flavobacterium sp. FlaQc-47]|uniref:tetratricopeptide repeat protein n=1 Tax=Flavobacterium sp. FlaQc-47 TaxID=3374180 RepID=UPI0037577DA7
MRYVSNLIPEKAQVLKEYFKASNLPDKKSKNTKIDFLRWVVGVLFLLIALSYLKHLSLTLLFGFIGFMLLPPGHNWIEKKFRFSFTTKMKSILGIVLFLFSIPLLGHYTTIDKKEAHLLKIKTEHQQKLKAEQDLKEKIRNDSLVFYIEASSQLTNKHKTDEAIKKLKKAFGFVSLPEDKTKIAFEEKKILTVKAFDLVKSEKYKLALPILDTLITQDQHNSNLYYNRAICYSKVGKIKEAVSNCKTATQLGDKNSDKLYDKINPIKMRVAYYVTRCCDGSTSGSSGRGTCSHHGGVCNWNEPVYEQYRKYE